MSWHSLGGLVALNLLFLVAGAGVLWGIRGWQSWGELLRLGGVAYLLGVATVSIAATEVLVAGGGVSIPVVLVLACAIAAGGVALGYALSRPWPRRWTAGEAQREPLLLVAALFAGIAAVVLAALFRSAVFYGLYEYDSWAFWTYKAKAIYELGGLDVELLRSLPGQTYPLLVPALEAMDFHFMGSADDVTLHVQFWFLTAGFLGAAAGLLRPRVPLALVTPALALIVLTPTFREASVHALADLPLDYFFVAAALASVLWLERREPWLLAAFAVLLSAAMSTKREGQLLAACLVAGLAVASVRQWRRTWLLLFVAAAGAFLATLPWRIWWTSHGFRGETPETELGELWAHRSRIFPALRLVLELVFDEGRWLILVPLAIACAVALLLLRRGRRIALVYVVTALLATAGFTWITWAIDVLPTNPSDQTPIPRAVGAIALLSAAFSPLMLSHLLPREVLESVSRRLPRIGGLRVTTGQATAWAVLAAVGYAAVFAVAGLASSSERSCPVPPARGGLKAVFVTNASLVRAQIVQTRARTVGFTSAEVGAVACDRYEVAVHGIPPGKAVEEDFKREARSAGFEVEIVPG